VLGTTFIRYVYTLIHPTTVTPDIAQSDMAPALQIGRMDVPLDIDEEFNTWYNTIDVPSIEVKTFQLWRMPLWLDDDRADHPTLIIRIAVEDTVIDEGARRAERYTLRLAWLQISRIERLIYGCRRVCGGSCIHPGDGGADLHLEILRSKLEFLHHH
jgi:hypothetical protein